MKTRSWIFPVRFAIIVAVFVAVATLGACASTGPTNSITDGADGVVTLKGHDPVTYFTIGKHTLGNPGIKAVNEGATYRFASKENKAMFNKEPGKHVPQYDGFWPTVSSTEFRGVATLTPRGLSMASSTSSVAHCRANIF